MGGGQLEEAAESPWHHLLGRTQAGRCAVEGLGAYLYTVVGGELRLS